MDRVDWLKARRTGIGGSDAAAILGLSEWSSPYSVWADKLGLLPDKEDTEAMRIGRDLEDYVAKRFAEKSGKRIKNNNKMFRHQTHDFMIANIDRDIIGERSGLECKTASAMSLKKFKGGEFPVNYYCQCVHYMTVLDYDRWYLAALVLGVGLYVYQLTRIADDAVPEWCDGSVYIEQDEIDTLIKAEHDFWQLVTSETPPEIDASEATSKALKHTRPSMPDKPDAELFGREEVVKNLEHWKQQRNEADKQVRYYKNLLIDALDGATRGVMHGYEVVVQTVRRQSYTVQASEYTQIRIKEN